MKKFLLVALAFCLCGCLHSKEVVTINADGSGMVETSLKVHQGTVVMVDQMLGGMMQAFAAMGQQPGQPPPPQISAAEEMFGDKKKILEKITKAGVDAQVESFAREKKEDGLYVNYKVKTSDIAKLARSEVMGSRMLIMKNEEGDWFVRPIASKEQAEENASQKEQLEHFKSSPQFQSMPPQMQQGMFDLKVEAVLVFPSDITDATGVFEKKGSREAAFSFSMDSMMDPAKMLALSTSGQALARTGKGSVPSSFFERLPEEIEEKKSVPVSVTAEKIPSFEEKTIEAKPSAASNIKIPPLGDAAKVQLKNGTLVEGKVVDKGDDFVTIDSVGVPVTYYTDEIERIGQ